MHKKTSLPKRTQVAVEKLQSLTQQLGPGGKMPTMNELVVDFGVSKATLAAALSHLEKARVIQRRHGVGIFVSAEAPPSLIAILFDPRFLRVKGVSPYWNIVWHELASIAQQKALDENVSFSFHLAVPSQAGAGPDYLPSNLMDDVAAGRINGILAVGISTGASDFIEKSGVPLVTHAGSGTWQVHTDTTTVVSLSVEYLYEIGCRKIGVWNPSSAHRDAKDSLDSAFLRANVFSEELKKRGLKSDFSLYYDAILNSVYGKNPILETHQEQGYQVAMDVFGGPDNNRPDGLIITDDMMAQGALTALGKMGIHAGLDLPIVSHSNKGSAALMGYEADIARVEFDPHEVAETMFRILKTLMQEKTYPEQHTVVQPTLIRPLN